MNFEEFQGCGGVAGEQLVAAFEGAPGGDFLEDGGQALPDAGDIGDLAVRVFQDVLNAFGIAIDDRGPVAIAADAEAILARDFHEVGGFG